MGKYSGNGMGPAFRVFWPSAPSKRAIQAEAKRQQKLKEEAAAADREVQIIEGLDRHIGKLVRDARAAGMSAPEILEALAREIREARRRAAALAASRK